MTISGKLVSRSDIEIYSGDNNPGTIILDGAILHTGGGGSLVEVDADITIGARLEWAVDRYYWLGRSRIGSSTGEMKARHIQLFSQNSSAIIDMNLYAGVGNPDGQIRSISDGTTVFTFTGKLKAAGIISLIYAIETNGVAGRVRVVEAEIESMQTIRIGG